MKIYLIVFILGLSIGSFLVYKFFPNVQKISQIEKQECKAQIITKKLKDGTTVQTVEVESKQTVNPILFKKPTYKIYVGLDKSFGAGARVGNLPLWIEGGYSLNNQKIEARLSYEF